MDKGAAALKELVDAFLGEFSDRVDLLPFEFGGKNLAVAKPKAKAKGGEAAAAASSEA
jgi:hypothetical protein